METVQVAPLSQQQAMQGLDRCAAVSGFSVRQLTDQAQAFRLRTLGGEGVFVLQRIAPARMWIQAAQGSATEDLTAIGLAMIEAIAQGAGCSEVAFETRRKGLAFKASRAGYVVESTLADSIVMKKELPHGRA